MAHKPARVAEAGFTLVELLVVLAIIGLLTTVVVINVAPMQGRARVQKAQADIAILEQALEFWHIETGRYPTTEEGLRVLTEAGPTGAKIKTLPADPWGHAYAYAAPGADGQPFVITSWGADGRPGGSGNDADISSNAG